MIDLDLVLSEATLQTRTVPVCLDGSLTGALADAVSARADYDPQGKVLDKRVGSRGSGDPAADQLDQAVAGARRAVQDAALPFRIQALSRPAYWALVAQHPARTGEDVADAVKAGDRANGWDTDTFPDALVRVCLIDPQVSSDEQWQRLCSVTTDAQMGDLSAAAMEANRARTDVPFSPGGSGKKTVSG